MLLKDASVLIIDDDPDVLTAVRLLLKSLVREVTTEKNPEHLRSLLTNGAFDLILLDMNFKSSINTGNEGLYFLKKIKELRPESAVVMITAYGDIDLAVSSLKEGAADFLIKPWHNDKLIASLKYTLEIENRYKSRIKRSAVTGLYSNNELLGSSLSMQDIFYKIEKIAPTDANILILGENGTGKDLVARAIHQKSSRAGKAYVKVDIGSLTETLFESELFGSKKGAFTDAKEDRTGRFEAASGGTLFLDEIGNISLHQQARLLSVLQNRQVVRLGDNLPIPIDIRLICATNMPLNSLADETRFRKDLVYRINTVEIVIPPLRKRGSDIIMLAENFSKFYSHKYSKPALELDKSAKEKLMQYYFPGNVRELQSTIERAVIMAEDNVLYARDIIFSPLEDRHTFEEVPADLKLSAVEKSAILKVIEKHNGNISKAAKELGLTRTALYRRLNKYEI